jgi:hypothetical protein
MDENKSDEAMNLTTYRDEVSVWNRRGWDGARERVTTARWLLGAAGMILIAQGIRRRSPGGALIAGAGSGLAWWALTDEQDRQEAWRRFNRFVERIAGRGVDRVMDASTDSFPASDAPAWTPTVGTGLRRETNIAR